MRGGEREGAGRKPMPAILKKNPVCIKLQQWLIEWTKARPESRAVLVETALQKFYKLKPPTRKE